MTKKPIIAVDIDEVLFPLHEHFLKHHNEQYGTDFLFPDPEGRYLLQEFTGEEWPVMETKLKRFYESGDNKHLQPLSGAVDAIRQLNKNFDLVIVSNQLLFQGEYSKRALIKHIGDAFKGIYFTSNTKDKDKPLTKSEMCLKVRATYLIDDNVKNAASCAAAGVKVLLFGDYHWNKHEELSDGITRVKNWQEVLEYFDARDA